VPDTWSPVPAQPETSLVSEHVQPLWNTWSVLLLALSIYVVELVWRRRLKLL
jgi:hypothetical protein